MEQKITPTLIAALAKFHSESSGEALALLKERLSPMTVERGKAKKYSHHYVQVWDVLDIINPCIAKYDLCMSCLFDGHDMVVILMHKQGGYIQSRTFISTHREGKDPDSVQWRASRFTISRRTAILGLLNLDDGTPDLDGLTGDTPGEYFGVDENAILDQKGAEVVENLKVTIGKMNLKPVKATTTTKEKGEGNE